MVLKSPQLFCAPQCCCSLRLNPIIAPELQGISCQWLHLHAQHTLSNAHVLTKTMTMMSSCRRLGLMLRFSFRRNTRPIQGNEHSFLRFRIVLHCFRFKILAFLHFNLMTTLSLLHMLNSGRQECRRWQVKAGIPCQCNSHKAGRVSQTAANAKTQCLSRKMISNQVNIRILLYMLACWRSLNLRAIVKHWFQRACKALMNKLPR